ncbi:MAG: PAS domain-containing sensor histidine kinase [Parvularculaceae bacterium]|nr:PAS domain-containing sensor histidine kinase [Parvularculaceae bacterium]
MSARAAMGGVSPLRRARELLPDWAMSNTLAAAALAGAAIVAFATAWFLLSPAVERADRSFLIGLIVANVVIAAAFATLIGARLWHVWSNRQNQIAGAPTHFKLVLLFSALAVIPAIIAFLFAFTIMRSSLNDIFGERIEKYQNTARDLANGLIEYKKAELELMLNQIAYDVRRNEELGLGLEATPISFREYIYTQAEIRRLDALYIIDGDGRVLVRAEVRPGSYRLPSQETMADLKSKPAGAGSFGVNDERRFELFRVVLKIPDYGGGFLIAYQPMESQTGRRLTAVTEVKEDWEEAKVGRARAERVFLAGYVILAFIILFAAIWIALWAATRFVQPIGRLIEMAGRVSGGELGARVEVYKEDGEIGVLARSMNHMTAQLQTQRDDLIETNKQFDRRRLFTEAVLSGVSAGVVGVTPEGRIAIANRSAAGFFARETPKLTGVFFTDILPEASELFDAAASAPYPEVADQITVERDGRIRTLSVRIVSAEIDGARSYVVTFDDISELISAQRSAAWGDVARRIAHEIKNPLTPIQLSAERLRRKYASEIKSSPEIFDRCTETIIRHVGDIGRMVDEFSSFARMPKPAIAIEDMREIVRSAVFPQKVALPDIEFTVETPASPVVTRCDARLIVQAMGNLLKNAGESIGARLAGGDPTPGRIRVVLAEIDGLASVAIADNGVGLPKAERHRLTEPYMTTRAKGTGLGLAIVNKVIEDHEGRLKFDDCTDLGLTGAVVTFVLPLDMAVGVGAAATAAE